MKLLKILFFAVIAFTVNACSTSNQPRKEGVEVGGPSVMAQLVSAQELERDAAAGYASMMDNARAKGVLLSAKEQTFQRVKYIAMRMLPFTYEWNPRAQEWKWEENVIKSDELNAFCMPGGKIAFYTGIVEKLKLTDAEVAVIMGHEMAHALREHARQQIAQQSLTKNGLALAAGLAGLGDAGGAAASIGAKFLGLKFSRDDEAEADLIGIELAARAGYNPAAGVTLWQKMNAANARQTPEFLSTHPGNETRISYIQSNLDKVQSIYERSQKPNRIWSRVDMPVKLPSK